MGNTKCVIHLLVLFGRLILTVDSQIPTSDEHFNETSNISQDSVDGDLLKEDQKRCKDIAFNCADCVNTLDCNFDKDNCIFKCISTTEDETNKKLYTAFLYGKDFQYQMLFNRGNDARQFIYPEADICFIILIIGFGFGIIGSYMLCNTNKSNTQKPKQFDKYSHHYTHL